MTFAEGARRLAGVAGVAFGWAPDAFWRATPEELAVLFEAAAPERAAAVDVAGLLRMFPDCPGRNPLSAPANAGVHPA